MLGRSRISPQCSLHRISCIRVDGIRSHDALGTDWTRDDPVRVCIHCPNGIIAAAALCGDPCITVFGIYPAIDRAITQ